MRYDPEAGLIDSTAIPVVVTPEPVTEFSAAFDGEKIFLAFTQNDDIYGVFLDSDLQEINRHVIGKYVQSPISINPNPVRSNILKAIINMSEVPSSFEIYDVSGRKIDRCRPSFRNGSVVILELPGQYQARGLFPEAKARGRNYRTMFLKM